MARLDRIVYDFISGLWPPPLLAGRDRAPRRSLCAHDTTSRPPRRGRGHSPAEGLGPPSDRPWGSLRLLVAADTSIDPHRLLKLCSDHARGGAPSVSLLVPVDLESRRSSGGPACAESLLRAAIALLDAAGIRLEDIAAGDDDVDALGQLVRSGGFDALLVCPSRRKSSPVRPAPRGALGARSGAGRRRRHPPMCPSAELASARRQPAAPVTAHPRGGAA
jgi:hypothetical protein